MMSDKHKETYRVTSWNLKNSATAENKIKKIREWVQAAATKQAMHNSGYWNEGIQTCNFLTSYQVVSVLLPANYDNALNNNQSDDYDLNNDQFIQIEKNYPKFYVYDDKLMQEYIKKQFGKIEECLIIGDKIDEGGFSTVYKGFDTKYKLETAIKLIKKQDENEFGKYKWLATQQISCLKQISHENVLKLLGYNLNATYENNNCIMFVLEIANNGNMTGLIKKLGYLPEILARTYFRQIIKGIEACHKSFVIHRDIKCDNILLDTNYSVKISDFGLSKVEWSHLFLFNFFCFG